MLQYLNDNNKRTIKSNIFRTLILDYPYCLEIFICNYLCGTLLNEYICDILENVRYYFYQ